MLENQDFRPAQDIAPLGELLTIEALPRSDAARWGIRRGAGRVVVGQAMLVWAGIVLLVIAAIAISGAVFAPYVFAELVSTIDPHTIVAARAPALARGQMIDDYWAVQRIDSRTYAIGEPRYYQGNYAYLILGDKRALLFDSGSGTRDIGHVVAGLTRLPVTVIPSHLHYDHLGGVAPFSSVAMIDLPETRADVVNGRFVPGRYEYLGFSDGRRPPSVTVTEWLKPGARIDLGGRIVEVIHTPGHTTSSVSLFDRAGRQLYSGDFLYPTTLYADFPGASLSAYEKTAAALLATLPPDTKVWTAHCCRVGEKPSAPWLTMADIRDLDRTLRDVEAGRAHATGFYPRLYPINRELTLATGFWWNNR
jgi:glyoxylase-like metal-dependent hydrolase (beta-lactamase superfamily II)